MSRKKRRGRPKGSKNKPKAVAKRGRPPGSKNKVKKPKARAKLKGIWATVSKADLKNSKVKNQIPLKVLKANLVKLERIVKSRQ